MPPTVNYYNSSTVSGSSLQGTLGALAVRVIPSARVRRGRDWRRYCWRVWQFSERRQWRLWGIGVTCSTSVTPGYNFSGDCASYAACIETFYGAIQSAPIVQGATAIEEAWPAGTCDIGSVSPATFGGQSFNFGTQACLVWTNYIEVPLSAILLVVYAVAGVFIILSA